MSAHGGGRGRGSGGDGQPPPQDFLEDQSMSLFAYFNPNQPQGRGTPFQPLGFQATGTDFFSTYGWYMSLNPELLSMIYACNQQQLPTSIPQPQYVDIENVREEHIDVDEGGSNNKNIKRCIEPDVHTIAECFESKYPGAWASWGEVPTSQRDLWFNEFKKHYYWDPEHEAQIRRNFELRGAK
ncbi:hypothetical protein Cgig2_023093 [Carnegiea gigantea]|uniref:Uncharacterized protein n=1 Tax=Carnegiea gigantea TaxID=171969 RepID=A0A9Q1GQ32_9CARY|nr:hypothetical protein Cgig2_023093 [Carnegiea gigantea]